MRILRTQGIALLRKLHYMGTDLVLKSRFMTFRFPKSPFFDNFQEILNFFIEKFINRCILTYVSIELSITIIDFLTHCISLHKNCCLLKKKFLEKLTLEEKLEIIKLNGQRFSNVQIRRHESSVLMD